jgi:hypothetical protein
VRGAEQPTMEWFSLWLPLVSQVVPVTLLAWLTFGSHATRARSIVVVGLVATYIVAIGVAGLWLVSLGGFRSPTVRWWCWRSRADCGLVVTARHVLRD